jgi:hypothetical protein
MMPALIEGSQERSGLTVLLSGIGVERHTPVFQTGVEGALPSCPSISATRNPGVDQNFTDLAAVVQLRLRVAFGLQTLTVKSRLLTGENSVRIRGNPPISGTAPDIRTWQFRARDGFGVKTGKSAIRTDHSSKLGLSKETAKARQQDCSMAATRIGLSAKEI